MTKPPRVRTAEDSVLTRSRGCGDIAIGCFVLLVILGIAFVWMSSRM